MTDTPTTEEVQPREGDLKVWYVPQIGGDLPPFEVAVSDVTTGIAVLDVIAAFSLYEHEHHIKPDYADLGGIARYETDGEGGMEWADVEIDPETGEEV